MLLGYGSNENGALLFAKSACSRIEPEGYMRDFGLRNWEIGLNWA